MSIKQTRPNRQPKRIRQFPSWWKLGGNKQISHQLPKTIGFQPISRSASDEDLAELSDSLNRHRFQ